MVDLIGLDPSQAECAQKKDFRLFDRAPGMGLLNCRLGRIEKGIEPRLNDRIALARSFFHSGAVVDLHQAAAIADERTILQRLGSKRDRRSVRSQDSREKLVRIGQRLASSPIVHHEKPATYPLFYCM